MVAAYIHRHSLARHPTCKPEEKQCCAWAHDTTQLRLSPPDKNKKSGKRWTTSREREKSRGCCQQVYRGKVSSVEEAERERERSRTYKNLQGGRERARDGKTRLKRSS